VPLSKAALNNAPDDPLFSPLRTPLARQAAFPRNELATLNGGCAPASPFSLFHKRLAIVYVLFLF
jgi:hypothetical protein